MSVYLWLCVGDNMCIFSHCVLQNRETHSHLLEQQLRGEIYQLKQKYSHLVEQNMRERRDLEVLILNMCTYYGCSEEYLVTCIGFSFIR